MSDSDDDVPQLSADTFLALQEFYQEQEEREKRLVSSADENATFDEDWVLFSYITFVW